MLCLFVYHKHPILTVCLLAGLCLIPAVVLADTHLDGTFLIQPNGDINTTIKMTMPLVQYQRFRDNNELVHQLFRQVAPLRGTVEVTDRRADWDDINRTVTISFKGMGEGRNLGNRWEISALPNFEFSNLDENKRTLYLHQTITAGSQKTYGSVKIIFPSQAQQVKWDGTRRVVTYVIPPPKTPLSLKTVLWVVAAILFIGGLGLYLASLAEKTKSPTEIRP